jgi:hypothetical protein
MVQNSMISAPPLRGGLRAFADACADGRVAPTAVFSSLEAKSVSWRRVSTARRRLFPARFSLIAANWLALITPGPESPALVDTDFAPPAAPNLPMRAGALLKIKLWRGHFTD